ncbi:MAG: hypothetical protein B6D76_03560 [gamma proteobacterium symbiont of Stewartia floridana]|nr:MAG: hypothetical protein B6D76_03560 [gamma proteobacterium symbiont of Stewartia floridana]RLW58994.1 MAG: hypothetical protein B6D75_12000 [gamma proteobacterium symbiont of Stewartia floridana]
MIEKDSNITLVKSDKSLKDGKKLRKPRIGRLNSALDVRREMARVYKKARHGEMDLTELNGYIKALSAMLVPIRDTELEERIKRLEGNG